MTLRAAVDGDVERLLDVWYQASLIAHPFLTEEFLRSERTEIAEHWLPLADTTVCELDGGVVGFLALIGNEVGAIFVDPDHQGVGVGRALMDNAAAARPHLELSVFEANHSGRRFYAAYGFEQVGAAVHAGTGQPELRLRYQRDSSTD